MNRLICFVPLSDKLVGPHVPFVAIGREPRFGVFVHLACVIGSIGMVGYFWGRSSFYACSAVFPGVVLFPDCVSSYIVVVAVAGKTLPSEFVIRTHM